MKLSRSDASCGPTTTLSKEQGFLKNFLHHLHPAGPHRYPDGQAPGPGHGPGQEKVRHVETGDQENRKTRQEKEGDTRPESRALVGAGVGLDVGSSPLVRFGVRLFQASADPVKLGLRLLQGYIFPEPAEDLQSRTLPTLEGLRVDLDRQPDIFPVGGPESLRHDSHDLGRLSVHSHHPAHDGPAPAEPALPCLMRDERYRRSFGEPLFGEESPAC